MTRVRLKDVERELVEPYLPIGGYGPYPERLGQQFEGVIRRFKAGGQWREMPQEFGAGRPFTTASGTGVTQASSRPCWRT